MDKPSLASNPFALMMHPDAVLQALACSDRLSRLQRRICKPLDKPLVVKPSTDSAGFDKAVDSESDPAE